MPTTRLIPSAPFWVLVGGSVVAIAAGAFLLTSKLTAIDEAITQGTATGVEVYAGQIWAVLGAILVGAGLVGLALALTLGALGSLLPAPPVAVVEPPAWQDESEVAEVGAWAEPAFEPAPEPAAETAPEPVAEPVAAPERPEEPRS